ncbi:MAG: metal ABC transporter substrate-binding protein [Oscillospiraceae bacterium]|jgi:zinc transport system substrate-binding protein|nr:metal ABC transporter substrate-binding protein [Oscillospiraceae bacterium]
MKRWIACALAGLILAAGAAGCAPTGAPAGNTGGENENDGRLSVVATTFAPFDFARVVVGDKADVSMLLPPAAESHSFEPTPQDTIQVQNCDVFLYVGGDSDAWVDDVLSSMDVSRMKIITLMDCVEVVEEEIVEGMEDDEHDHEDGEEDEDHEDHEDEEDHEDHEEEEGPEYDEHVWTSPRNAKLIVQKISDAFCEEDAANADTYRQNTASYLAELDKLDAAFQEVVAGARRKTIVLGDRFPFRYFVDAYGLDYFAAFPGCSTETEPSAATVAFLIDKINAEQIPVVFHIELSNEKMAEAISEATGAQVRLLHAAHNISKTDFTNGVGYLDVMWENVDTLKEALG